MRHDSRIEGPVRHRFLYFSVALAVLLSSCGGEPPLTLYVSNQSHDDPNAEIIVLVGDRIVVDQTFRVGDQHNWVRFAVDLEPGAHQLVANSDSGLRFETEIVIPEREPRWAVLEYWWEPERQQEFTFRFSEIPVGFD